MQQLSVSFGVAAAGLTTVFFVPDSAHSNSSQLLDGLHLAFLALGSFTVLSTLIFSRLKASDGANETHPKTSPLARSPVLVAAEPGAVPKGQHS